MMDPFLEAVKGSILRHCMAPEGSLVLAAHSGGPDSTALLFALSKLAPLLRITVESLHFDHGLRPESAQDAQWAAQTADRLKIPFWTERDPSPPERNIQERARAARYAFFERMAKSRGALRVATGHTLDDTVETSIMWMLRGAGPSAFGGLPPVRGIFIRPLIDMRKSQILDWINGQGLSFITDKSNLTDKYQRNRIRRHIIPAMEKEAPQAVAAISRLARMCGELGRAMEEMAEKTMAASIKTHRQGRLELDPSFASNAPMALRGLIYKSAAKALGADPTALLERHVSALDHLIMAGVLGRRIDLPGGLSAAMDHGGLIISTRMARRAEGETAFACPLTIAMGEGILRVEPREAGSETLLAALDKIPPGAVFRGRLPGDYLIPRNFQGRKKLKKYLIEKRVPSSIRDSEPILAVGGEALWIPGLFISHTILAGPKEPAASISWTREQPLAKAP